VHGGVIMKMVDEAGAIVAMRHAQKPCVTIAIDSMTFKQPVHVGQLMVCKARVTHVGRSSIEVQVLVHAENLLTREVTHTNSAYVVYVSLGPTAKPRPRPRCCSETNEDHRLSAEGATANATASAVTQPHASITARDFFAGRAGRSGGEKFLGSSHPPTPDIVYGATRRRTLLDPTDSRSPDLLRDFPDPTPRR